MGRAISAKRLGDEVDETRSGAIRDAWLAPMTLEEFLYLDLGNTRTGYSRSTPVKIRLPLLGANGDLRWVWWVRALRM
jgi:hypothetical protein